MNILRDIRPWTSYRRAALLCLALGLVQPARAEQTTIGPFLDFSDTVSTTVPMTELGTKTGIYVLVALKMWGDPFNPPWGFNLVPQVPVVPCAPGSSPLCQSYSFRDGAYASPLRAAPTTPEIPVKALSYFTFDASARVDAVQITTLYGVNDVQGGPLSMTGFDPVGPALEIHGEKIIGRSGAVFAPSSASMLTLEQLPSALGPGFDTSMIWGGPHEHVYRFQTTVPLAEVTAVPEPTSALLLILGLATVLGVRRRHRQSD